MRLHWLALSICLPAISAAQKSDSVRVAAFRDSVIRANSHSGELSSEAITGDAGAFLLRESMASQFVVVGERHDIKEIPQIVGWLLNEVHSRSGFSHLSTENGSLVSEAVFRRPERTNADSVLAFATRYPNAFEFASDQDLSLIGMASSRMKRVSRPVWGIDQEFGAANLLDRLRSLPSTAAARTALDSLSRVVNDAERLRYDAGGQHWMGVEARPETFRRIKSLYGAYLNPESARILDALEISAHLYDLNRRASKGEPVGFTANDEREQMMRRNFVRYYNEAKLHGEPLPKVLVKMGQAHAGRGQSPFGPFSVGDLISNMATANGTKSFHVAMLAHNAAADSAAPSLWKWPDMKPLAESSQTDGVTVVDLRPIRPLLYSGRLGTVLPDLRRLIYSFDAVMLIGGASDATQVLTQRSTH